MRVEIKTVAGVFVARFSDRGLAALEFPGPRQSVTRAAGPRATVEPKTLRAWTGQTRRALVAVLSARPITHGPPLDLSAGTAFQQRVWSALRRIAPGRTQTYSELAAAVGQPRASRAVGGACGANPIPVIVPCHRVVAANGGLGGFSGGLNWKVELLAREGTLPPGARGLKRGKAPRTEPAQRARRS